MAMLLAVSAPALTAAQTGAGPTRAVTLIEVPASRERGPAMVYRRAAGADRDVIALAPGATAEVLGRAFRVLDALYARFGDSVERDMAAAARADTAPSSGSDRAIARGKLHASFVSELRRSPARHVAGFGSVKALRVTVPGRSTRLERRD